MCYLQRFEFVKLLLALWTLNPQTRGAILQAEGLIASFAARVTSGAIRRIQ